MPNAQCLIPPSFTIATPRSPGAIAVITLMGTPSTLDAMLGSLRLPTIKPGQTKLCDLLGVDRGLLVRWSPTCADLMPHGGPAIVRTLVATLIDAGIAEHTNPDPQTLYPEADDPIEARILDALSRAQSPRAIDLLLDQPRRWAPSEQARAAPHQLAPGEHLRHLLTPPLIAIVGPPNIGKSSLLNALAGRAVALAFDQPGTTRDHIGVMLELDGLSVRAIDTQGIDELACDDTHARTNAVIAAADLVVRCADARSSIIEPAAPERTLRVALRADLGTPDWRFDCATSAKAGEGIAQLARLIRTALIPDEALNDPNPWEFWSDGTGDTN